MLLLCYIWKRLALDYLKAQFGVQFIRLSEMDGDAPQVKHLVMKILESLLNETSSQWSDVNIALTALI